MAPADVRGGLAARARAAGGAAPDALVGVHPLVGDGGDLGGVAQQSGDERAADLGELVLGAGLVEGVPVTLEEGEVGVHSGAGVLAEGLGHERGLHALLQRDLLHHQPEGHDVVGGGERVGVAQVDFLLAGGALVVAELDRDAHGLQHRDGLAAEVHADVLRGVVEVAGVVGGHRAAAVDGLVLQQEELDLGVGVEGEAEIGGPGQHPLEDEAGVREGRRAVRHEDVAEHPGGAGGLGAPGQDLEGAGVRFGDHVGFVDPGEALDGGAVEADALVKRLFQFGGCDGDGLQEAQHIGEPEAHEADVALLQRAEHKFLLLVHCGFPSTQSLPVEPARSRRASHPRVSGRLHTRAEPHCVPGATVRRPRGPRDGCDTVCPGGGKRPPYGAASRTGPVRVRHKGGPERYDRQYTGWYEGPITAPYEVRSRRPRYDLRLWGVTGSAASRAPRVPWHC
nr:putative NAD/FAD-dependent oxidoreductase [Streptomyces tsukubensis NRRL18488]